MTPEELLKPRYKVIADFWDSPYKVGDIINFNLYSDGVYRTCPDGVTLKLIEAFECYPQFKKLEWWEDRKESDMPQYVKWKHRNQVFPLKDLNSVNQPHLLSVTLPATKEEYEKQ